MKRQYTIPIFVPYMEEENYFGYDNKNTKELTVEELKKNIDTHLQNLNEDNIFIEVAFLGESFTKLDIKTQEKFLNVVGRYIKQKKVNSIRISTKSQYITKDILKMLKRHHVKTIELEVLSTNHYILKKCGNDTNFKEIKRVSKLIKWYGFNLGHQMMIGLPESNKIDDLNTAKDLIKLKPKMIRIYPAIVMQDTILEHEYKMGNYEPITLGQAVERCKELVYLFNKNRIHVIRINSQIGQDLQEKENLEKNIVVGPYHEAFGQLVEDSIWYDSIVEKIKKFNVKVKEVKVCVNSSDVIHVIGYEKSNADKLKDLYDVDIKVESKQHIKPGKSELEIIKTYDD